MGLSMMMQQTRHPEPAKLAWQSSSFCKPEISTKSPISRNDGMWHYTILLALTLLFSSTALALEPKDAKPEDIKKNDAQYRCVAFVTDTLDDPKTAKFEFFQYFPVTVEKDGSYTVLVTFNDGASKHIKECKTKEKTPDAWQLISLKDTVTTPETKNAK